MPGRKDDPAPYSRESGLRTTCGPSGWQRSRFRCVAILVTATLALNCQSNSGLSSGQSLASSTESAGSESLELDLAAVCERVSQSLSRLNSVMATIDSVNPATPERHVWTIVAAKDRMRSEFQWHGRYQDRGDDPVGTERYFDGSRFDVFFPHNGTYETTRRFAVSPYTRKILFNFFFECLGWWPPGDSSDCPRRGDGSPEFLCDIISDERCRLLPDRKSVDGCICSVLYIPRVVRLWIDPVIGMPRRREQLGTSPDGAEMVIGVYDLREFEEVVENVWLPRLIERHFVKANRRNFHRIVHYEVNNVSESKFNCRVPPGTLVYDRDCDESHQIPGGLDMLERRVGRLKDLMARQNSDGFDFPRARGIRIGLAISLGILVWLLGRRCVGLCLSAARRTMQLAPDFKPPH